MSVQFERSISLTLTSGSSPQTGLDLSDLHIKFTVSNADVETPNIAIIRIYNVSDATARKAINEFDGVVLQAGYKNNTGIIFRGTVKQFKRGRESNVDNFLDIYAADSDLAYNFGFVNKKLAEGITRQQKAAQIANGMGASLDPNMNNLLTGGALPRGKVLFGLGRVYMGDIANTNSGRWSLQQGKITFVPLDGYLPGVAVKINSLTGMIGIPEATDNGVSVQCLLNPQIKIGNTVQINARDITRTEVKEQIFPNYNSAPALFANVTYDGLYRVLV